MKIALATTTWYPARISARARAALEMLRRASKLCYKSAVVDGGSCPEFLKSCSELAPWVKVFEQKENGMGPSRRQAILEASRLADAVWWTEEKPYLIHQLQIIGSKMKMEGANIVVPTRRSLESYPEFQRKAEIVGNIAWRMATGSNLDMWSGPRLIDKEALPHFLNYKGEYDDRWDSIFVPVVRAIAGGLKVLSCDVDYIHSPEQTAEEEADPLMNERRRIEQLWNLVPAIEAEAIKLGLFP